MADYTDASENPIVQSTRDKEPSHFIFEIESFGSLKASIGTTKSERIESTEFSADGRRWALIIYPNGNKKEAGAEGYISLYLKLLGKVDGIVYTSFKFFIFDRKRETFTVIQDVRERKFDAGHPEWGVVKALPVTDFMDENKGWLVNDSCTFGVEVHVIKDRINVATSRLSLARIPSSHTQRWDIKDFSSGTTNVDSAPFGIGGRHSWKLYLHIGRNDDGSHSLYLCLDNGSELTGGNKVLVQCEVVIKDELYGTENKKSATFWFDSAKSRCDMGIISHQEDALRNQPQLEGQSTQTQTRTLTFEATIKKVFSCSDKDDYDDDD